MIIPLIPALQEQTDNVSGSISKEPNKLGKCFLFDFTAGDFVIKDGRLQKIDGLDALKIWIEKILKTEKYKFMIYETGQANEYGIKLRDLIDSKYPKCFAQAEMQREITEALSRNPEIIAINNFSFIRDKGLFTVNFDVSSIYGSIEEEVSY